jgi:hypothetical protein
LAKREAAYARDEKLEARRCSSANLDARRGSCVERDLRPRFVRVADVTP